MPLTIEITISDEDVLALKHDIIDPETWVRDAVAGKIASCRKRMSQEAVRVLCNDPEVETIPASEAGLTAALAEHPSYKDRAARDADETAKLPSGRG